MYLPVATGTSYELATSISGGKPMLPVPPGPAPPSTGPPCLSPVPVPVFWGIPALEPAFAPAHAATAEDKRTTRTTFMRPWHRGNPRATRAARDCAEFRVHGRVPRSRARHPCHVRARRSRPRSSAVAAAGRARTRASHGVVGFAERAAAGVFDLRLFVTQARRGLLLQRLHHRVHDDLLAYVRPLGQPQVLLVQRQIERLFLKRQLRGQRGLGVGRADALDDHVLAGDGDREALLLGLDGLVDPDVSRLPRDPLDADLFFHERNADLLLVAGSVR